MNKKIVGYVFIGLGLVNLGASLMGQLFLRKMCRNQRAGFCSCGEVRIACPCTGTQKLKVR
jgi:hypothetical protein